MENKIGVILMTYGSATKADYVGEYMAHIYPNGVPVGIVEDFKERYRLAGYSPLVEITEQQAILLEERLNRNDSKNGKQYIVRAGMRHSKPFIETAVSEIKQIGAQQCLGIILSPQFSSVIMQGYREALLSAAKKNNFRDEMIHIARSWPTEPHFIRLLAGRIRIGLGAVRKKYSTNIPVIFTTHSLPKRVIEKDPNYLGQLEATTRAILKELNDSELDWRSAYQSAGHTPEEWLKPDLTDILAELRIKKIPAVLIVPIQFLVDHLEILYDLDIAARKQCEEFGISYHRTELPNLDPLFIEALDAIVKNEI